MIFGSEKHNYKPPSGYVPNEATALRVAEAILEPIYGRVQLDKERPFKAELNGNIWHVYGAMPPINVFSGVAEIWISKTDCKIIRVTHGE